MSRNILTKLRQPWYLTSARVGVISISTFRAKVEGGTGMSLKMSYWEHHLLLLASEAQSTPSIRARQASSDTAALKRAYADCGKLTAMHSRSFYLASCLLPAAKRPASSPIVHESTAPYASVAMIGTEQLSATIAFPRREGFLSGELCVIVDPRSLATRHRPRCFRSPRRSVRSFRVQA